MLNNSAMTSQQALVDLVQQAKMDVTSSALINLNASTLTVNNGSLINVAGGSFLNVGSVANPGFVVSLTGGSALTVTNGALVGVSGGSVFSLTGSFGSFGTGANTISLPTMATGIPGFDNFEFPPSLSGFGVALVDDVSSSSQIEFPAGSTFTPFQGLGGESLNSVTSGGIVLQIEDADSRVRLCTTGC